MTMELIFYVYMAFCGYFGIGFLVCVALDEIAAAQVDDYVAYRPCSGLLFLIGWPVSALWVAWRILVRVGRSRFEWL